MKIGVIGSGHIGGTLAKLWAQAGHQVALSHSRGPESLAGQVAEIGHGARAMTVEDAAAFGEVVLVAIPLGKYRTLPAERLAGKIVIDAMNYYPGRDGEMAGMAENSSRVVAGYLTGSRLVKAFNTMNYVALGKESQPSAPLEDRLVLYLAGDDQDAVASVEDLIREIGFTPLVTGTLADGAPRQQPGASIYNNPVRPAEARRLLGKVT
ncbi:MAG: NADPH-dependent F420 reductase [Chloroflexota bacterium]